MLGNDAGTHLGAKMEKQTIKKKESNKNCLQGLRVLFKHLNVIIHTVCIDVHIHYKEKKIGPHRLLILKFRCFSLITTGV